MQQSPPPGPLAPSQHTDVNLNILAHPLDGWHKSTSGAVRIRETTTAVGMLRLTVLRTEKQWGFSIRLVTPVEGVVLRDWMNTVLVPCGEKSVDEPWGWRPYAKTEGATFRFSPSGVFMGYVDDSAEMAIISETVPQHTMRDAMKYACLWAVTFSQYIIPVKPKVVPVKFKPTKTQQAIIAFLDTQDQRRATHLDMRAELCQQPNKVTSPSGLTMSLGGMQSMGWAEAARVNDEDGWRLTDAVPVTPVPDDYEEEVMADLLADQ